MTYTPDQAWADANDRPPTIPSSTSIPTTDWHELGQYDWSLSLVLGWFGDDEEENEQARSIRNELRQHIPHLSQTQLRLYLAGLQTSMEEYLYSCL